VVDRRRQFLGMGGVMAHVRGVLVRTAI
jgi:hypothetical protein